MRVDYALMDELAAAARAGNAEAVDALVEQGYELVEYIIRWKKLFLPRREGDFDDLVQEGMQGFVEALRDWNPDGQEFHNFAITCVYRELVTLLKRVHRKFRQAQLHASSLDAPLFWNRADTDDEGHDALSAFQFDDPSGLGIDPVEAITKCEAPELLSVLIEPLSNLERETMIRFMLCGQSYKAIAAAMGIGQKSVDNALQRIRRKLTERAGDLANDPRLSVDLQNVLRYVAADPDRRCPCRRKRVA